MDNFYISIGTSKNCTVWKNQQTNWVNFCKRFETPMRTQETVEEYHKMIVVQQGAIKDVGGFVGGYLEKGKRKINSVKHRSLICLDLDNPIMGVTPNIKYVGLLHSTHKHTPEQPRYRLIIPLMTNLSSEEYEYVSRYIAKEIKVFDEFADKTTYQTNRLMYWPSCPVDGEYIFKTYEGDPVDGKQILKDNPDWKSECFQEVPQKDLEYIGKLIKKKQADPTLKGGVIGAFCKAYSIEECIDTFLTEKYIPTDIPDRYTWSEGSTSAGVLLFESQFSYSFHSTDPCSMRLCNAYDLIRIHLYKENEKEALTFCAAQKGVGAFIAQEEFGEDFKLWQNELEYTKNGDIKPTMKNFELILQNNYDLKFDDFKKQYIVNDRPYSNHDDSLLMSYIESTYGVYNEAKVKRSVEVVGYSNLYNPVQDYLNSLKWDGVERLDTTLIKYFHSTDDPFVRESFRNFLIFGIMRIFEPGSELQHVLVLSGQPGIGKSSFIKSLCPNPEWFNDSLTIYDCTKDSKTAGEHLTGHWIFEIPEMAGMKKAEVEPVKAFITRSSDKYRPAFGRVYETYKRQCIFFASTNSPYLLDVTGNRRFWTIKCPGRYMDQIDRDQLWAEAVVRYRKLDTLAPQEKLNKLKLSKEALRLSKIMENEHIETDERSNFVEQFIEREIPLDWRSKSIYERIQYLNDELTPLSGKGMEPRKYVTVAEVWCELYQKPKSDLRRTQSNEIIRNFTSLGYTEKISGVTDPCYGRQIGFTKPPDD